VFAVEWPNYDPRIYFYSSVKMQMNYLVPYTGSQVKCFVDKLYFTLYLRVFETMAYFKKQDKITN
jgi:hypothetical protein